MSKATLKNIISLCLLSLACSCFSSDPFLYDKAGFEAGTRPNEKNPEAPIKVAPDYYYRQPNYGQPTAPAAYQQPAQYQQQQQQYYYPQQPVYYYPPVAPNYNPYGNAGGSRFYSNPYAIPASAQYPNYDADQYYVPPTYYQNVEPQQKVNNTASQNRS